MFKTLNDLFKFFNPFDRTNFRLNECQNLLIIYYDYSHTLSWKKIRKNLDF